MAELIVQIATLGIVGALVFVTGSTAHLPHVAVTRDRVIGGLGVALVVLYLLHLVPLPPSVWDMLPGREALKTNLKAFDERPWLPLTVAPYLTVAALLSLIPPFCAYALASCADRDAGRWVMRTLAVFAVLTIGLQLLQKTGGLLIYAQVEAGYSHGFQANRNSQGDLLAILMAALAFRQREGWSRGLFAAQQLGFGVTLLVAAVLTGSRSGIAMTGAMFLLLCFNLLRHSEIPIKRQIPMLGLAVLTLGGIAAWLATTNAMVIRSIARFAIGSVGRTEIIWPDAIYTALQFMPWGAGFGAFMPAFQIYESQETFTAFANRAHSEPLEVLIEAGIPGAIIVAGLILATLWRGWGAIRRGEGDDERSHGGLLGIVTLLLLAHSMVDYPMRSMSIAVLFATLLGLVVADRNRCLGDPEAAPVDGGAVRS